MKYYFALQNKFKFREHPKKFSTGLVSLGIILLAFVWMTSPYTKICSIHAISSSEYCYKYDLQVSNSGGTVTNYPVRVQSLPIKSWIESNYVDKFGWSFYSYGESLSSEKDLMLQNINSNNAVAWQVFSEIETNSDKTYSTLVGSIKSQRNQGIYLYNHSSSSGDYVRIANNNDFNVNNFEIILNYQQVCEEILSVCDVKEGTLLEKYDEFAGQLYGFKIQILNLGTFNGTPTIRVTTDQTVTEITIPPSSVGKNQTLVVTKDSGGTVQLRLYDENGYDQSDIALNLLNTPVSSSGNTVTTNSKDMYIGATEDNAVKSDFLEKTTIRYVEFRNNSSGGTPVGIWGFNPSDMAETQALDPNYSGTITDITGRGNNANYFFNRTQSNFSVSRSSLRSSTISASGVFTAPLKNIAGKWYGDSNPFSLAEENDNLFGISFLRPAQNLQIPVVAWYSLWLSAFSVLILIALYWMLRNIPLALLGSTVPYVLGGTSGLLPLWFVTVVFLVILGIYSTSLWVERS